MGFRMVSKSMTLNDPEPLNGRYFALFYRMRQTAVGREGGAITSKWLKIDQHCLR